MSRFYWVFILSFLIFSCKKKDTVSPVIWLEQPFENMQVAVGEDLLIVAKVSDDKIVESVTISILNDESIAVVSSVNVKGDSYNLNIKEYLTIDNVDVESGTYRLVIRASDGINETRVFRNITIEQIPRYRRGVAYITSSNTSTQCVYIDSVNVSSVIYSGAHDFISSSFSAKNKQLYICGKKTGPLVALNTNTRNIDWTIPTLNNGFPTFANVGAWEGIAYTSFFDGSIKGYTKDGGVQFQTNLINQLTPGKIVLLGEDLIVEQFSSDGATHKLSVIKALTGNGFQEIQTGNYIIEMFHKNADEIIYFENVNQQGRMMFYNIPGNYSFSIRTLDPGIVHSACKVSDDKYMIANGTTIYSFNYSSNNYLPFLIGKSPQKMVYDELNSELFTAEGKSLNIYDISSGSLKGSITALDSIRDFQIIYNK